MCKPPSQGRTGSEIREPVIDGGPFPGEPARPQPVNQHPVAVGRSRRKINPLGLDPARHVDRSFTLPESMIMQCMSPEGAHDSRTQAGEPFDGLGGAVTGSVRIDRNWIGRSTAVGRARSRLEFREPALQLPLFEVLLRFIPHNGYDPADGVRWVEQ